MSRTAAASQVPSSRPPIVVVGVEQEWAARSLDTVLGPRGFAVVRAYSGRQTLDLAEVAAPDVVLIDSRLPDIDGIDVCRLLRTERRIGPHVPIVIMTSGTAPREFMRDAYTAGAWSVWEQPVDGELLLLRLENWVAGKRVVDAAERVSLVDFDSGLYTYRGLSRRAGEVMADASRRRTPVTCIAIGATLVGAESAGAEEAAISTALATDIGRVVARVARGSDVVGRLGASEFAILAPMTEHSGAVELVERLRDKLAAMPLIAEGRAAKVSLRAGLATTNQTTLGVSDGSDLLQQASTALRFAQSSRTVGIRVFDQVPATFV
jgi:PleD family two-component response regulator